MRAISTAFLPFLVLTVALGCSGQKSTAPDDEPDVVAARQIPPAGRGDVEQLVQGNNAFACDLYAELRSQPGNLFISPYSISSALAMTWAGARATTEAEMSAVLHFPFEQERLHPACGALQRSLDTGLAFENYQLNIANRLWGQTGYAWLQAFLDITQEHYGAGLEELDFYHAPEACRLTINAWVAERTAQKIEELLPPRSITPTVVLVLTNAIYFKGDWLQQFDPAETRELDFSVTPARSVRVPMMGQVAEFAYGALPELSVLELPYDGEDLSMVFLLPARADGVSDLEAALTAENLAGWLAALAVTEVTVLLPRFEFSTEFELRDPLIRLGMVTAFGPGANFTGMRDSGGLFIDQVYHEAFIRVDEEGSEAAGATAVVIREFGSEPQFVATHPFLFLILDRVTGQVLFLGRVVDPSA